LRQSAERFNQNCGEDREEHYQPGPVFGPVGFVVSESKVPPTELKPVPAELQPPVSEPEVSSTEILTLFKRFWQELKKRL
jgi:hypothetical protein